MMPSSGLLQHNFVLAHHPEFWGGGRVGVYDLEPWVGRGAIELTL